MAKDSELPIGNRRWLVNLCRRVDSDDPSGPGLVQTYTQIAEVWAAIEPLGTLTYYESIQTDTPITHKIFIRWRPDVRLFDCVIRNQTDVNGNSLQEVYMIKRSADWQGRQRYSQIEARLETRSDDV